jgi:electron transfer flavoprotein alpha/beta subunit
VERLLDHGYDAVAADLPAVISVVKEINEPRMPSFKAKLKAKKEAIPAWGLADLDLPAADVGLMGSFTQVVKVFPPPPRANPRSGKAPPPTSPPASGAGSRNWEGGREAVSYQLSALSF